MTPTDTPTDIDVEQVVHERYGKGAVAREAALCCPVDYDPRYLEVIPERIIERDYGCGDPSRHLRRGATVLDLGSGGGKICFIASQVVGPEGRVIGVDMNPEMLSLARRYQHDVGERIGWHNVDFRRGRIQDLRLDLDAVDTWLERNPVTSADDLWALEAEERRLRKEEPLVPDLGIDVVVSNCVLNLVSEEQKEQLFTEIFRVLRPGGRAVISDIVADEPVPDHLRADAELWSGCISGAMTETGFIEAFERAGFYGMEILSRGAEPWRTVEGIEFRSVTVQAFRGKEGPCYETNKALVYRGPWKKVIDDDGHVFQRGVRSAVCEKTFQIMTREPYTGRFEPVLPRTPVDEEERRPFDCDRRSRRDPRETKGMDYNATTEASAGACEPGGGCC
ncbi:MAG: methyltransferase domain-containing protein [Gemmatimonadota bacterium]